MEPSSIGCAGCDDDDDRCWCDADEAVSAEATAIRAARVSAVILCFVPVGPAEPAAAPEVPFSDEPPVLEARDEFAAAVAFAFLTKYGCFFKLRSFSYLTLRYAFRKPKHNYNY